VAASRRVVIGADTHLETNHLAVLTDAGQPLADAEFPTCPAGYDAAVKWAQSFGGIAIAGVEGTSSYGAGLTRVLQAAGIEVAEVSRPDRAARRRKGKSDPLDAYAAARAALAGHGLAVPKGEHTTALGALLTARRGAVKARSAATNQIHALLVYRASRAARALPSPQHHRSDQSIGPMPARHPQRPHHRRGADGRQGAGPAHRIPRAQKHDLTAQLDVLVQQINPALRTAYGVGPDTAAQLLVTAGTNPHRLRSQASFAALCGAAPSQHPRAKSPATDSPVAVTAQPTMPCIASRWCACRPTHKPATTSSDKGPTAGRRKRFCGCSNEPSPAKYSDC
jgi:transposase